jgi:hypothetical protein
MDISPLWDLLKIMVLIVIVLFGYFLFTVFKDKKTIKCTEKPSITYEFKAKGQKIDTVWIYKFK